MRILTTPLMIGLCALGVAAFDRSAEAAPYPVSGRWSYNDFSGAGPARHCGAKFMEFRGEVRSDTGGSVPQYHNVSVTRTAATAFRVVDEFFTVQVRGRASYSLRVIDQDHIELHFDLGNRTIRLRRCM
jgi:hypothetical protein